MLNYNTTSDPVFRDDLNYTVLDRFFLRYIRDKRDLPFIYLTIRITFSMVPLGILLFLPVITGWIWWVLAVAYLYINNFVFKGPFGLMLHCTSHRPWFKKEHKTANRLLPWVIGPFFGQSPDTYFSHHIGMHHLENNLEADDSSTMHFQRDSFRDFLRYYLHFMLFGIINLSVYFRKTNRKALLRKAVTGELFFILMCIGLSFVNLPATFVVFILPLLISRFVMMLGNFAQHSFVDAEDPGNSYKNSITCINVKYNHRCWNDGYHISHHIKSSMHWTEHPNHLKENIKEYAANKALIFDGIDFLGVFYHLMRKNYSKLADHIVNLDNTFSSKEEVIELMKARTKRIPKQKVGG